MSRAFGRQRFGAYFLIAIVASSPPVEAYSQSTPAVLIRNKLSAGTLEQYTLTVNAEQMTRDASGGETEKLKYEQAGRITLYNLSPPQQGKADRACMLELDEATVDSLSRDGQMVSPQPDGIELGLPPRTAHLRVVKASVLDSHLAVAGGTPLQQALLWLALDVVHWSQEKQSPGGTWQHELAAEYFTGTRKYELAGVEGRGRDRKIAVTASAEGEFRDLDHQQAKLETAVSRLQWDLAEHSLLTLESKVRVRYGEDQLDRELAMSVNLRRIDRKQLDQPAQQSAREQLEELVGITDQLSGGSRPQAITSLRQFLDKHKQSLWLPVVQDLYVKSKYQSEKLETLSQEQLISVLVQLLAKWQTIAVGESPERLEPLRAAYAELAEIQRPALLKLIEHDDGNIRALAVFCLAFSSHPEDLATLHKSAADMDARVRAWSTYALAERGSPQTDLDLLERLLSDPDANVRQRACMAARACVPADSPRAGRFSELLLGFLRNDGDMTVRYFAASSLFLLARPLHLPELRKLLAKEKEKAVQDQIAIVVRRLEAQADTPD